MSTIEELAEPLSGEEPADTGQEENIRYFRDILLRLTFAAHGWDDRLDGVLEQLQDELRSKDALPDLKNYSEILYRALMRAEESRPAREPGQIVAKAFSDLEFPPQLKEEWGSLMEQSRLAKDEVQALEVLEQCASLLGRALKEAPATKAGKKPGLLASLFGSDNRDQDESGKFIKAVQHRLLELMGSLCPPPELEERLDQLKDGVAKGLETSDIPRVLEQINLMIQDIRGRVERERLELEKFLGTLMDRLSHIEGALEETDSSTREVFASRQKLDAAIEVQTRDMESCARDATDLGMLKKMVQERVDTIRKRMDEHHDVEQQLVRESQQRMSELMERLHKMEEETDDLRNQVQEERLEQEYARWQRYESPLSVMIVDVDHFKRINDTYGHQAGDKALRIIARELAMAIRKTDFIGRYGGEEIVILMPETPADAALVAADKLRQRIEKCGFHFRDKKVTITVSCGLSEYREGDTPDEAFERADQALYVAKKQGRNRCVKG